MNELPPKQDIKKMKILEDNKTSLTLTTDLETQNCS